MKCICGKDGDGGMKSADSAFLAMIDGKAEEMKEKILRSKDEITYTGTAYYVSEKGDDRADGLTPETAWRTPSRVTAAEFLPETPFYLREESCSEDR